ncbi:MAG TPA: LacI family DNA-binding transcriptional regulator [Acidobacteriaceae bacterium]|nr:LacI family DNA-binding transcriptional regulator [Acidobacteriaceae bacterium]
MQTPKNQSSRRRTAEGRASLSTLSEHLGLSPAAISRVLNGAPAARSIPQATQKRIFDAARELNYRPNVLARSLRRGKSMTLGVLVPEIAEGYTALVLAGLEQGLQQAGYFYLLISHHHRADVIERSVAMMTERAVDGLIAIDTALPPHVQVPTVTVSCQEVYEGITSIVLNHDRAAELAIGYLAGLGHREIAIIKGQPFSSDTEARWQSIRSAAQRNGITLQPALVAQLEEDVPTHEPGYFAAQRLLAAGIPFTALFAFNDISAIGAIRALREAGRHVPQDVSVIGFDDIQSAAFQNPSLTTVRQPLRNMGLLAAETVLQQINADGGGQHASKLLHIDPELIVRESTARANPGSRQGT